MRSALVALALVAALLAGALAAAAPPPSPLLPDLVPLVPTDLRIDAPDGVGGLASDGCRWSEVQEGARRCLRFTNAIANLGPGPLHLAPAGRPGDLEEVAFEQWVAGAPAGAQRWPAGVGAYHAVHHHFHYEGLVDFRLHAYDLEAGRRGAETGHGGKQGFCLLDSVRVPQPGLEPAERHYRRWACRSLWSLGVGIGISAGWADVYGWRLHGQMVEVSGLPDGVYELVTVADGSGTLREADESNNEASVVFRLAGDRVEVLREAGLAGPG